MDKSSWFMLLFMFSTMVYFILQGSGTDLVFAGYLQVFGFALLGTIVMIAISCIPVLIYCYIIKIIPDNDYSIRLAFALVLVGILYEFVF